MWNPGGPLTVGRVRGASYFLLLLAGGAGQAASQLEVQRRPRVRLHNDGHQMGSLLV